ncbi:hypothetical protein [Fontivita pretiosa]|uniref:hypothetical protein n=1 Tax=Fontivita pretiosa TaxID=2989684 RepID=UPI003D177181
MIRLSALEKAFPGGWEEFVATVPNRTLCADGELARVGFMIPADIREYVEGLEARGLVFLLNGAAQDIVIVDQRRGFTTRCDWAEFGHANLDGDPKVRVALCRLKGSKVKRAAIPFGWKFEESLSCWHQFTPSGWGREFLQFLRHEDGIDIYRDLTTGKTLYIGRTSRNPQPYF